MFERKIYCPAVLLATSLILIQNPPVPDEIQFIF
jgi:hypothetical protein